MKPVFLLGLFFFFALLPAYSQELYSWVDTAGKVHVVDKLRKVPENYRQKLKVYQALPKLREAPASERETIPETPTAIVPEKGQPLMSSSPPEAQKPSESPSVAPDETSARVRAILQREEAIKKEKERMTALYSRFREFQTRSTVYRNSIKELDQETENLQKQLDALRAKQQ